jgi:hypothetical protein
MGIHNLGSIASLAAGVLIASCASPRRPVTSASILSETIIFQNRGPDRIQVYLIGQRQDWLLGRLDPMETARLRLPAASWGESRESVMLAVLPGWTKSLAPRSDRRATLSIAEIASNLPGAHWSFANGQLQGPRR